jgi:hypothetical protein
MPITRTKNLVSIWFPLARKHHGTYSPLQSLDREERRETAMQNESESRRDRDFTALKFSLKILFYFFPNIRKRNEKNSQKEMLPTIRSFLTVTTH